MKVIFSEYFYQVYTHDPAAASGRMESVVRALQGRVEFVEAESAAIEDIAAVHTKTLITDVRRQGLYEIAALAAGAAIQTATIGLSEPCFGLIRPPGHHASADSCWGFCFFNNMAVAITALKNRGQIQTALILDIDLHFGDGTVDILRDNPYARVYNVHAQDRIAYLEEVAGELDRDRYDIIGISAGFDNHEDDWGRVLKTEDYYEIGRLVRQAAFKAKGGYFALLEGGYNHRVLGQNALALIEGMERSEN